MKYCNQNKRLDDASKMNENSKTIAEGANYTRYAGMLSAQNILGKLYYCHE